MDPNPLFEEIVRASEKTGPERDIALRLLKEKFVTILVDSFKICEKADLAAERFDLASSNIMKVIDGAILDSVSAPGMPSPYEGKKPQDVMLMLKRSIQALAPQEPALPKEKPAMAFPYKRAEPVQPKVQNAIPRTPHSSKNFPGPRHRP